MKPVKLLLAILGGGFRRVANEMAPHGPSGRSVWASLRRLSGRRRITTVVDVGASDGRWSAQAHRYFRDAQYLLVEAQGGSHEAGLRALKARHSRMDYVIAAAGAAEGTVHFDATDAFGGMASDRPFSTNDLSVPMITLDAELERRGLHGPYLVKLDTHGYELPILDGAARALAATEILVVEAYNFQLSATCLRFHELCTSLEARGFRCIDVCDLLHRPGDGVLWQMDLVFVKADSGEFESNAYAKKVT